MSFKIENLQSEVQALRKEKRQMQQVIVGAAANRAAIVELRLTCSTCRIRRKSANRNRRTHKI
jgi:hypothetical protein